VSTPGFRDLFSRDSASYARFRPRYPPELFAWLATLPAARRTAWDCATGNGQAASLLAPHFQRVVGTDASPSQLRAAEPRHGVAYLACLAERTALADRSVDLVTVAQAFHWLDRDKFYSEVDRVIALGGALAIVTYARLHTDRDIERAIHRFQDGTVGPYWMPERRLVESGFAGISIPIEEVTAPSFAIEAQLTLGELLGYVGTWSAVGRYRKKVGQDPLPALERELGSLWGDPNARRLVEWPLCIRAGQWRTS
jgi:SAM-dependent methyltransferase